MGKFLQAPRLYRGSYMSAHVLLNLLNELGKRDKMRGFAFKPPVGLGCCPF